MRPIEHRGTLATWKDDRGFGFIQPEDGSRRVFLHISDVCTTQRRPKVGDLILYQLSVEKDGKVRALNAAISGLSAPIKPAVLVGQTPRKSSAQKSFSISTPFPLWLEVALLSALPLAGSVQLLIAANPLPLVLYVVMAVTTYIAYREDKFRARNNRWRISEKTLQLLELAGGWLGGFIAQRQTRHKSRKASYQITFWSIVLLHLAFWVVWLANIAGITHAVMSSIR